MMRKLVFIFSGLFFGKVLCEECGGILEDDSGWITAPDSDGDGFYDNEADCWWAILAQNNSAIEITFWQMDLQQNVNCFDDFLEVYDGNQFLATFCGDHLGPSIVARSDSVILHFQSDWEMSAGGFNVSYKQINGFLCGSTEILVIGTYVTLDTNGDGFYDHNLFCQWDIKSTHKGSIIRLYYTQFDIPESRNCTMDYLLVFSQNQSLGVYCGPYRPPLFVTTWPVLSSIFTSGCCANGKGLLAVYTTTQDERCGEILINKTGVIQSVDSDNDGFYDNNQNCWWVMVAPHNGIIDLEIQRMEIEYFENCEYDYIWLYDGDITTESSIGWVCGNYLPPTVRTISNILFVQFYSDEETSDTGFIAQYRHAWPCGSSEETLIGQFGSLDADADGLYDHNVDCIWFIRTLSPPKTLQVYISKFDIPPSLNCSVDYLQIYDDVQSYGTFCGTHGPPLITTTERVLSVEFHTECCFNGEGFSAVYSIQDDCGGILAEETGIFQSHDDDNNGIYDDDSFCWWVMVAPPNTVIELEFTRMAIQDHAYCNHDYIQIYDGEATTEAVLGYYCGYILPPTLRSTSNVLLLQFVSDSFLNDAGFTAEYRHVNARHCGTIENKFWGTFTPLDADADGFYDSDLNCAWEIHSFNPARITSFYLTEFDIPASDGCALDYLRVYDEEHAYGVFCGANRPPLITTPKVVLLIEFQSDCCISGKGFMAVFVQHDGECGGILIQSAGSLQSIDRDNDGIYDANQNCIWALVAPEGWIVEITFLSITIQHDEDCDLDSLQVNDQVLCGAFDTKTFRAERNLLLIHFYTDSEYEFAGWTAEYRHVINATRRTSPEQSTFPPTLNTGNGDHGISHTASITSTFSTTAQDTGKITITELGQTDKITPDKKTSGNPHQVTTTTTDINSAATNVSDKQTATASTSVVRTATTVDGLPSLHTGPSTKPNHAGVNTLALCCQILLLSTFVIWQCLPFC